MHPTFKVDLFSEYTADKLALGRKGLLMMMEALTCIDQWWLRGHPNTPPLYGRDFGLPGFNNYQYIPEVTTEEWLDFPNMEKEGGGDCEDVCCGRTAEYREGIATGYNVVAMPHVLWRQMPSGKFRFHGVLQLPEEWMEVPRSFSNPDGIALTPAQIEDPSAAPGMQRYAGMTRPHENPDGIALMPAQIEDPSAKLGMLDYYDYLQGNLDKQGSAKLFEKIALREVDRGNTRAAATIRLRIKQLFERNWLDTIQRSPMDQAGAGARRPPPRRAPPLPRGGATHRPTPPRSLRPPSLGDVIVAPNQAIVSPKGLASSIFDGPQKVIILGGEHRNVPGDNTSHIYDYPSRVTVFPAGGLPRVFDTVDILTVFGGQRGAVGGASMGAFVPGLAALAATLTRAQLADDSFLGLLPTPGYAPEMLWTPRGPAYSLYPLDEEQGTVMGAPLPDQLLLVDERRRLFDLVAPGEVW